MLRLLLVSRPDRGLAEAARRVCKQKPGVELRVSTRGRASYLQDLWWADRIVLPTTWCTPEYVAEARKAAGTPFHPLQVSDEASQLDAPMVRLVERVIAPVLSHTPDMELRRAKSERRPRFGCG